MTTPAQTLIQENLRGDAIRLAKLLLAAEQEREGGDAAQVRAAALEHLDVATADFR